MTGTRVFAMPRWAYVPGQGNHVPGQGTGADMEMLTAAKSCVPTRYADVVAADDAVVSYGLALNDHGLFWESHEILEAVWKVAPQGGCDRILLRACIQVANANLKTRMERPGAAIRLFREALDDLTELSVRLDHQPSAGFAQSYPLAMLRAAVASQLETTSRPKAPVFLGMYETKCRL